ncbi:MAG: YicC/YloC family endoribonuclease [Thermodesulfobacteriota bacterium]
MIKSMTAFSRAEMSDNGLTVAVEIRSYNSRYLDLTLRVPQNYFSLEERIKGMISEAIVRGRVEVKLQVQDVSEAACAFEIDEPRAAAYHKALAELKARFGLSSEISLDHLVQVSGIIKPAEIETDLDRGRPLIESCVDRALSELNAMRQKEGDFLARDFEKRLDDIEAAVDEIASASEGLLDHYRERLQDRITALTQGMVEIDPSRIAQEAAFLADRSDISEEIVRSRSHVQQFRTVMRSPEPAGKKLNFLLQEFNREFNTMGSKTGRADVSHTIVQLKSELEKIREQVQNVE